MANDTVVQLKERTQTNSLIEELLLERKQVWSLFCTVSGIEEYKGNKGIEELIRDFRQLSIDYISLGHFGVYQRVLDGSERRKSVISAAERIYPKITKATEVVLDFSDKYEKITPAMILQDLSNDLSAVGEQLASRIELEDELLSEMIV